MIESLSKLPAGSDVFLDANVLIYATQAVSPECRSLLSRCATQEIFGVTSFLVLHEVTHRLMLAEAKAAGLLVQARASELEKAPEVVRSLSRYWQHVEAILNLDLLVCETDNEVMRAAQKVRKASGLLTNDSLIVATMATLGIQNLASNDRGFERIPDISLFAPEDLA